MTSRAMQILRGVRVRTVIGVLLVSGLIWLYAEAEGLTQKNIETRVRIRAPQGGDLVTRALDEGWNEMVTVRLEGPRGAMDAAERLLARGIELTLGMPELAARPGERVINLRDALRLNPPLDRAGVAVTAVEPRDVRILIEQLVTLEDVEVALDLPQVELAGEPTIAPQRVRLTTTEAIAQRLRASPDALYVIARPDPDVVANLPEGAPTTIETRLLPPEQVADSPHVSLAPPTVDVTLTIRSRVASVTLPATPVWLLLPPPELDRWRVEIDNGDQFLTDLALVGPSDVIERIRAGTLRVKGVVELTSEQIEARIESAPVAFPLLPPSVRVEGPARTVRLRIEAREGADGG